MRNPNDAVIHEAIARVANRKIVKSAKIGIAARVLNAYEQIYIETRLPAGLLRGYYLADIPALLSCFTDRTEPALPQKNTSNEMNPNCPIWPADNKKPFFHFTIVSTPETPRTAPVRKRTPVSLRHLDLSLLTPKSPNFG